MIFIAKYLQVLTCALFLALFTSCGAVKVEPVEEGDSLRYHARVGYFLHPPQRIKNKYIKNPSKYSDESEFIRCEPASIIRLYSRFERRYVEVKQGHKTFLFDTIAGRPIELIDGKYILIDKYFKKEFPLPTGKARRLGQPAKKSDLICEGKVWVGMTKKEFLIARPPPQNIQRKSRGKNIHEKWQYETRNHFLKEYEFVNNELQKHSDR